MATKNPRCAVSFNDQVFSFLKLESKSKNISISKVISELVADAIELREDYELSKIGDEAWERNKDKPRISHEEVWGKCDLK